MALNISHGLGKMRHRLIIFLAIVENFQELGVNLSALNGLNRTIQYSPIKILTMANTYTQIFIHAVFAVKNRQMAVNPKWETDLHKYISGIVRKNGHKLIAINGMPDHLHLFIGMKPDQSLSDLMQDIKGDSSKWINQKKFLPVKFSWQKGFGGFSYATSQVDTVVKYIRNQKQHHLNVKFIDEYLEILQRFNVEFDPKYIFSPIE